MRGPMMYPTPSNSGDTSAEIEAPLYPFDTQPGYSFHALSPDIRNL